jgi:ABC-2 type transport system permease protein
MSDSSLTGVWTRLVALILKEVREIWRNPYLLFLIIVPPVVQLLILGGALDPQVRNLPLGVVDHCRSAQSRDLISSLANSEDFSIVRSYQCEDAVSEALGRGLLNAAVVIPKDFNINLSRGRLVPVQVLVDGTDAYSAGIASANALRIISHFRPSAYESAYSAKIAADLAKRAGLSIQESGSRAMPSAKLLTGRMQCDPSDLILADVNILYNPGLIASWYFVPGFLGAALTLTSTLLASASVLRERESGTMEQILLTPASTCEILAAKVLPLLVFLSIDVCLAVGVSMLVFHLPCKGSFPLFLFASALYILVGIGIGSFLGCLCRRQRQSQLLSFFINIPLILLSGSVVPLDTMPIFLQSVSVLDPLRYYVFVARAILLKGDDFAIVLLPCTVLFVFAIGLNLFSANCFRRQIV